MANFKDAWAISSINEGGLANNPNDPGGLTYEGISSKFWAQWEGWPIVKANLNNIKAVKAELEPMVQDFYQRYFWSLIGGDFITDKDIANQLFDSALNVGVATTVKWIQKDCNLLLPDSEGIKIDGIAGKNTIAAIDLCITKYNRMLMAAFKAQRGAYYIAIIDSHPSQKEFFKSWISRLG